MYVPNGYWALEQFGSRVLTNEGIVIWALKGEKVHMEMQKQIKESLLGHLEQWDTQRTLIKGAFYVPPCLSHLVHIKLWSFIITPFLEKVL